jgi:hypothetical protein
MLDSADAVVLPDIFELDSPGLELLSISPFGMEILPMPASSPIATAPTSSLITNPIANISGMAKVLRKNLRNLRRSSKDFSATSISSDIDYLPPGSPMGMPLDTFDSRISESSHAGSHAGSRFDTDSITDPIRLSANYIDTRPSVHITISPNHTLPNGEVVERFLGHVSLHFVKENGLVFGRWEGLYGMGGFTHSVISEFYAILRYENGG